MDRDQYEERLEDHLSARKKVSCEQDGSDRGLFEIRLRSRRTFPVLTYGCESF
jgi:hypothetical protein